MSELLPCPFCGREPQAHEEQRGCSAGWKAEVTCFHCGIGMKYHAIHRRDAAAMAAYKWNTRYSPTCHMRRVTLRDEGGVEGVACDECGWSKAQGPDEPTPEACPRCHRKAARE